MREWAMTHGYEEGRASDNIDRLRAFIDEAGVWPPRNRARATRYLDALAAELDAAKQRVAFLEAEVDRGDLLLDAARRERDEARERMGAWRHPMAATMRAWNEADEATARAERAEAALAEAREAVASLQHLVTPYTEWIARAQAAEAALDAARKALRGGAGLIATERQRQMSAEGWTPEHDDGHLPGDLARAGAAYAVNDESLFPWPDWWKPGEDDVRRLVKAGALIAAELDRIARAALAESGDTEAGVSCDPRDPVCVGKWPECHPGGYDPRCCRFPKSCSCEG